MRIGFIGVGNMVSAIIKGYAGSRAMMTDKPDALFVYDSDMDKAAAFADSSSAVSAAGSLERLSGLCDTLVLCVKPNVMDEVLDALAALGVGAAAKGAESAAAFTAEPDGKLVISIAAGISIARVRAKLGEATRVVRVMPNTPAMVGEGMSAMASSDGLSDIDAGAAEKLFSAIGAAVWIPEEFMDVVTGISGSSPAYAYMYIEGLIRAGVAGGLSKEAATIMAAQATLGAAKMVLENLGAAEPMRLCANVCSPGGATIEAVKTLEAACFIESVEKAAQASAAKSKLMTR